MNFIRINIINNEMQVCGFMGYGNCEHCTPKKNNKMKLKKKHN